MHSAPDIFMVHGALGSARQMQPVAEALGGLGSVHLVELPGHGSTPLGAASFTVKTFMQTLADAVEHRAAERRNEALRLNARIDPPLPIVFGYSLGGYVALALESKHACTFGAIVTLGTKFLWTAEYAATEVARLNPNTIAAKIPAFGTQLEDRHGHGDGWEAVLANTSELMRTLGKTPALTRESLLPVRAPVYLAVGERDVTVSADETGEVASWMSNARAVVLPGGQHPIERVPTVEIVGLVRNVVTLRS